MLYIVVSMFSDGISQASKIIGIFLTFLTLFECSSCRSIYVYNKCYEVIYIPYVSNSYTVPMIDLSTH